MMRPLTKGVAILGSTIIAATGLSFIRANRKDPAKIHRAVSDQELRFGTGVWVLNLAACENGDVKRMARKAREYGLSHVLVKAGSGDHWYRYNRKRDVVKAIAAFHSSGIRVYGWNYVYGRQSQAELVMAKEVLDTDVDGLVFDVEAEYSRVPNKRVAAELICSGIRQYRDENYPGKILGYSTFCRIDERRVHWRDKLPLDIFGRYNDYAMPQAYWKDWPGWTPARTINEMCKQWGNMEAEWRAAGKAASCKPIIPTGHAYDRHPGLTYIQPSEVSDFLQAAKGYQGTNWWRWDLMGPGHWEAIRTAPRLPALKPPYKPVIPTGKEWWLVGFIRTFLWIWVAGFGLGLLAARYWRRYRRADDCLAYALLWPYLLPVAIAGVVIELRDTRVK